MIGKIVTFVLSICVLASLVESTALRRMRLMQQEHEKTDASETVWSIIAKSIASKRQNSTIATTSSHNISADHKISEESDPTTVPVSTSMERTTQLATTLVNLASEKYFSTIPSTGDIIEETHDDAWVDNKGEYFLPEDQKTSIGGPRKPVNGRERERNTKPPTVKKNKRPENPYEKRPALLLRLFPDGTAVLISRFQVQLHVKPKEIIFNNEERNIFEDILPLVPETVWTGGKSYEVTYKRLEKEPILDRNKVGNEKGNDFNETLMDVDQQNSTISTPLENPIEISKTDSMDNAATEETTSLLKIDPLALETNSSKTTNILELAHNKTKKDILFDGTEDPFFLSLRGDQMESLQRQYEPLQVGVMVSTTTSPVENLTTSVSATTTTQQTVMHSLAELQTESLTPETITFSTTTETNPETSSTTTVNTAELVKPRNIPECLSFKNQLSLALSTEDNIGNALFRRYLLPIHDCNTSDDEWQFTPSSDVTSPATPTLPSIISLTSTDLPSSTLGKLPTPFKLNENRQTPNHRTESEALMVTSVPMMILLQRRKDVSTDTPAWKEVTVGVVRDSQGKPIKAKRGYNNWTAHLRNMKKKPSSHLWYETSTPADFRRSEVRDQGIPLYLNNFQPTQIQERRNFPTNNQPQHYNIQSIKGLYYNGDTQGIRENVLQQSHQNRNDPQAPRFGETNNINWSTERQRNANRNSRRLNQSAEQRGPLRHIGHNLQGGNEKNLQRRPVGQESRTQQRFANQNRWTEFPRW